MPLLPFPQADLLPDGVDIVETAELHGWIFLPLVKRSLLCSERCGKDHSLPHERRHFRLQRLTQEESANVCGGESGAARGNRTPDPIITNDVLYQLSYCGDGPLL